MTTQPIQTINLARGQSWQVNIKPGFTIWIRHGRIALLGPHDGLWTSLTASTTFLDPEQSWVANTRGCVDLTAQLPTELLLIPA
jgi:hypothetical protein